MNLRFTATECKILTYVSVCLSCYASHGTWLRKCTRTWYTNTDLWPVHLSIIILSTDAQDLASLESAHQIGLTVFLHQRRMRFRSHSRSLQEEEEWENKIRSDFHFMLMHVLVCTGNGVLILLTRQNLYYAESSCAPGLSWHTSELYTRQKDYSRE